MITDEQKNNMAQALITDEEFDEKLKEFFDHDVKNYKAPKDLNEPSQLQKVLCLGIKEKDGKRPLTYLALAVGEEWDDDEKKHKAMAGLGMKLHEEKFKPAVMYHASDVWVSTRNSKDDTGVRPKDDPNHKDAILMTGMTLDGRTNMAIAIVGSKKKLLKPKYHFLKDKSKGEVYEDFILRSIYRGYAMAAFAAI